MNWTMTTPDKDKKPKKPGRKPKAEAAKEAEASRLLTLPNDIWDLLKELAKRRMSNVSVELRFAVRERLEKHGLLPKSPNEGE